MGYIRHHAIVVTGHDAPNLDTLKAARRKAKALGCVVTKVRAGRSNGFHSFCVLPDGSKEGWETSQQGDTARTALLEWLKTQDFEWVEVAYGCDDGGATVTRHAWRADLEEDLRGFRTQPTHAERHLTAALRQVVQQFDVAIAHVQRTWPDDDPFMDLDPEWVRVFEQARNILARYGCESE